MVTVFTFNKDFTSSDSSKFFLTDALGFREVSAENIANYKSLLITHDFWMICGELYRRSGSVPPKVVDLDEFRVFVSKQSELRKEREKLDVIEYINKLCPDRHPTSEEYKKIFYAEIACNEKVINNFHQLMHFYYVELCRLAFQNGEFQRFMKIEMPLQSICSRISAKGIRVMNTAISEFRSDANHVYYTKLKELSDAFDVPLENPSQFDIECFASSRGVDVSQYSPDFLINYHPKVSDYSESVNELRSLNSTRGVLNSIAVSSNRVHPIVDTQGSRTSRISVRNPYLQGLAKRYRNIIIADQGKQLCYVDFDQFEVGIMAALSRDPELLALYSQPDMYEAFRHNHLNGNGSRKAAKILFLAYAYGMKRKDLPFVGFSYGIQRNIVKHAFRIFVGYEKWKQRCLDDMQHNGFVSTSCGNRFYIKSTKPTSKEKLSAISQVVQGEGSLIFKKALLEVSLLEDVQMLLPMHDALLFQHTSPDTPQLVKIIFENTMSLHFEGKIVGKASIEDFFS